MKTYKDNEGREWQLSVNVGSLKRVKELVGFDLLGDNGDISQSLMELSRNPVLLGDVLYCLCKPQADKREISDIEFGESLAGDAVEQATKALIQEIVDFFPAQKRQRLQTLLGKMEAVEAKALELADVQISKMDINKLAKQASNIGN